MNCYDVYDQSLYERTEIPGLHRNTMTGRLEMNLTAAIMLVNKEVRPVRVVYDPDVPKHNDPNRLFKTLDPDLKVDDYVVVRTATRHGFTVAKVSEVGFRVNFDSPQDYDWIVAKVDVDQYKQMTEQEKQVVERIGNAEENRKRAELAQSLGLQEIDLTDLDIVTGTKALPSASPRGDAAPVAAPSADGVDQNRTTDRMV